MAKELLFGKDARDEMMKGVEAVAQLVGATLGPKGRCVVVERTFTDQAGHVQRLGPVTTKDGVSVARAISLPSANQNLGCDLIKEAALRTVAEAGDGTTASVVLAHDILSRGMKALESGGSPVFLRAGIDKAVATACEFLSVMAVPAVGREGQIARIAANGDDEIGKTVTDAVKMAGPNGIVSVDQSRTNDTHIEFSAGMQFDSGMKYQDFVTDGARGECILENPYILIHERRIQSIKSVGPLMNLILKTGRSVLLLSEEFDIPVVGFLLTNLAMLRSCPVVAPWYGERRKEFLKDIAVLTGGIAVTEELGLGLEKLGLDVLGQAEKVVITRTTTTIVGGKSKPKEVEERVKALKSALDKSTNSYEQEVLAERLAKLDGGVAIIKIGAPTESEAKERRDRTEDAVLSVKSAAQEGVVPGGGIALLRCAEHMRSTAYPFYDVAEDETIGYSIVLSALESPLRKILDNGGYAVEDILKELSFNKNQNLGFDALNGKVVDMMGAGIVDACKVVKQALLNAGSLAGTMLTAAGTITNIPEEGVK